MLKLVDITKEYVLSDETVHALRGVSLTFRESEFVSVLGPSGCGKTTLLNIIGGLDKYTGGDVIVDGKSTKNFRSADWDDYRNRKVGFVFQSYNLIPHLTVLKNVELALSLTGVTKSERRARAVEALEKTGLGNQLSKRPNQLSGGQMQRVAIARALVNNPQIILADEPTGALDSVTSVQVMDLLREVSRERLVVMVTHNPELAKKYSTRIINLFDGVIVGDTNPTASDGCEDRPLLKLELDEVLGVDEEVPDDSENEGSNAPDCGTEPVAENGATEEVSAPFAAADDTTADSAAETPVDSAAEAPAEKFRSGKRRKKKCATMPPYMAVALSFSNMLAKKMRTALTVFAGSIGIIGIALVLSLSNGFTLYLDNIQEELMTAFPLTISGTTTTMSSLDDLTSFAQNMTAAPEGSAEFPEGDVITSYEPESFGLLDGVIHINNITSEYVDYVEAVDPSLYNALYYMRSVNFHLMSTAGSLTLDSTSAKTVSTTSIGWQELFGKDLMDKQFDVLFGSYPQNANEVVLVLDNYNRVSNTVLRALGYATGTQELTLSSSDIIGKEFVAVENDDFYAWNETKSCFENKDSVADYTGDELASIFGKSGNVLKISGVLRAKSTTTVALLYSGIAHTSELTDRLLVSGAQSQIALKQSEVGEALNVFTGKPFEIGLGTIVSSLITSGSKLILTTADAYEYNLQLMGASAVPNSILIYPKSFDDKETIKTYLEKYNDNVENESDKIVLLDMAEVFTGTLGTMIDIVSYVLIAFAAISLIVSSIMIAIITYISVLERTKEIGILRSIGARKSDISWVFVSETLMLGLASGVFGIVVTYILSVSASAIVSKLTNGFVTGIAQLAPLHAVLLVVLSVVLTVLSGFIPAIIASEKNPVDALRSN